MTTQSQRIEQLSQRLDLQDATATAYDIDWRAVETYDLRTRSEPLTPAAIFQDMPQVEHISLAGICISRQ